MTTSPRPGGYEQALHGGRPIAFVYQLLRDHLPAGVLEAIVTELAQGPEVVQLSDDFLAARAIELNARLHGILPEAALGMAHDAIVHARSQA